MEEGGWCRRRDGAGAKERRERARRGLGGARGGALSRQISRRIINGPHPRTVNPGRKEKPLFSSLYRSPAQD